MDAATLRLILIIIGTAFLIGFYLWERRRAEERDDEHDWDDYLTDKREPNLGPLESEGTDSFQTTRWDDEERESGPESARHLDWAPETEFEQEPYPDTGPEAYSGHGQMPESAASETSASIDTEVPPMQETLADDGGTKTRDERTDADADPASDQERDTGADPASDQERDTVADPDSDQERDTIADPDSDQERDTVAGPASDQKRDTLADRASDQESDTGPAAASASRSAGADRADQATLLIQLFVVAVRERFAGGRILAAAKRLKLTPGSMDIFHRLASDDSARAPLYSMANLVKPGSFPLRDMRGFESPGLALFAQLGGDPSDLMIYDELLHAARTLAVELGGEVQDRERQPLTDERAKALRAQVSALLQREPGRSDAE